MIYFDNAATSFPKPECVISATARALRENSANPGRSGHKLSIDTAEKIYSARQAVANFFSCSDAENVIFTQNCTHSLNAVIKGFLKKGDHVLISNLEHNAVMRPIFSLAEKGLITFDTCLHKCFKRYGTGSARKANRQGVQNAGNSLLH